MTTRKYSSRSQQTTLTGALTSSGTTATVVSGSALLGGVTISAGETFTVVLDPDTALEEIVDVTAVSTNTLTIVRGIDGSSGQAHSAGAVVRHMAIGRDYREANQHIENTTTAHGITLSELVKTTDTGTVTSTMIANGTIVNADINSSAAIDKTKISGTAITAADTATVTSGMIATGAVGTAKIDDAAVTEAKIGTSAVTAGKIAIDAVTTAKIQDSAVTSAKIANDTIVNADINSAAAIDATKISGTAVTQADTGTITSTMIANGTIVNADVSGTAAIAKSKLDLGGTITSADIVDGTIVATDIADGTITAAKMVSDPYARANHTGSQAASTISDLATTVKAYRLDEFAAPTSAVSANSQKITNLATPTSNADASTKLYVDTKINDLINGAPSTLDTLKEIADAISSGGSFESTVVLKSGSTMTGALVLNADPSANLGAATKQYVDAVAGSATAAAASAAAAATTYDNFDDRYLGAKSSAPSVDNDGNALLTGALYWNSVSNTMFAWNGSAWGSISSTAAIYRYRYTATAGQTSVSGTDDNGLTLSYIAGKEQVYLNGVLLVRDTDYTASNGTSITSLAALALNDVVEIITFTAFDLATAIDKALFDAKGDILVATSADTPGKLTVGTDGQYLQADSTQSTGLKWSTVSGYSAPTLGSTSIASGSTVTNVNGLTINSTTIPTSKTLVATDSTAYVVPSQTGNSGKFLTTDGTTSSWAAGGVTHNIQSFTSSQTWTVPSSAKYVDVLVVGGGCGGRGGYRALYNSDHGGGGGGVTVLNNLFLNGTGTVSITVGAGSSGTTGNATTTRATAPSDGGFSAFGTYAYSAGGRAEQGGYPGYKGTATPVLNSDSTQSNYAPWLQYTGATYPGWNLSPVTSTIYNGIGLNAIGFRGGYSGNYFTSTLTINNAGAMPGMGDPSLSNNSINLMTLPSFDFYNLKTAPLVGTATAGTVAGSGGTAGPAGQVGVGGGGGTAYYGTGQHGQGGPGAGGGGGNGGAQLGGSGNGGNGGNAGTNTGAGGGGGGCTGSTTVGTGGNGGNGAAGIVVVHWIS